MHLSDQGLIVILVVGIVAGWLAGKVVRGSGFGLVGDAAIGIVGALIGDWLLHRLGIHFDSGIIGLVINATIGAIVLLLASRLTGASGWGGGSPAADPRSYLHQDLTGLKPATSLSNTTFYYSSEFIAFVCSRRTTRIDIRRAAGDASPSVAINRQSRHEAFFCKIACNNDPMRSGYRERTKLANRSTS